MTLSLKERIEAKQVELSENTSIPELAASVKDKKPSLKNSTPIQKPQNEPVLFVNGKLNKTDHEYINKNFYVNKELYLKIRNYCRGMDTPVFNYLLHLGLESITKEKGIIKSVDISEIEVI